MAWFSALPSLVIPEDPCADDGASISYTAGGEVGSLSHGREEGGDPAFSFELALLRSIAEGYSMLGD